ncbi:MAG TPA: S24 family peptidase [Candidatus Acidoferrum sp.]|nr:S24 family peptidase [Candidatus Acidoferrum sp.]
MGKRKRKDHGPTEWAEQIRRLRQRLGISQGELARKLDCSAMTVSRWENGQLAPTARYYVELGKLAGKQDCWFYWGRAGLQSSDVMPVLSERERKQFPYRTEEQMELAEAGSGSKQESVRKSKLVPIPVLQATVGTHGGQGDRHGNLNYIPARDVMGAPVEWCPNPTYTSLLRVRGHSMEPLIRDGDIAAVDSSQTDRGQLDGKIVIVTNEEKGLCVSRLRRYPKFDVLESENRDYQAVVLGKSSGWRIVARVLWWISAAP